ncbi:ABC transporter permease [Lawsonibacter celer]|uniref:ABC transporter permease n=1 Tax=Lawsonibacter celer TaxID=2986526 RepID=UPI0016465DEC
MNFGQSFRLALKSLMTSKMRAILTMLGIIIGVAAVIVITSLGNGMQQMMNDQFDQLGANLIQVQVYGMGGGSRSIDPDDMYELADKYPQYIASVSPYVNFYQTPVIRHGTDEFKHTSVYGVSEAFYDYERNQAITGESLAQGRFLSYIDVERYQNVCVIGDYLNQEMFRGSGLGQTLTIAGTPYKVIGVLAKKADNTEGSGDDVLYLSYNNASRMNASAEVNLYLFTSTNKDASAAAKGVIENRLYKTFQSSDYYMVMSSAEMMDAMNTMMNTMMVVLVAIAAISLLVGGIGIMNIMLVSVTERTREIGIRKSLGGKQRDIRSQFIIEAGTTSAIGGIIGIVVGILLAQAAGALIGSLMSSSMGGASFSAIPTVGSIGIAFGVSVAIGIAFGYLPANKAAKLNPIDALRYD